MDFQEVVDRFFPSPRKRGGFFIEAGAVQGTVYSVTDDILYSVTDDIL